MILNKYTIREATERGFIFLQNAKERGEATGFSQRVYFLYRGWISQCNRKLKIKSYRNFLLKMSIILPLAV